MQYWPTTAGKAFFLLSSICHHASAAAIPGTSSRAPANPSNITLPFSTATTYNSELLSILPSGGGIVVDSSKTINLKTTTKAIYTLSDGCVMSALKHGSSVIIMPGNSCSKTAPRTSSRTSSSSVKHSLHTSSSSHSISSSSKLKSAHSTTSSSHGAKSTASSSSKLKSTHSTTSSSQGNKSKISSSSTSKPSHNTTSSRRSTHSTSSSSPGTKLPHGTSSSVWNTKTRRPRHQKQSSLQVPAAVFRVPTARRPHR